MAIAYDWLSEMIYVAGQMEQVSSDADVFYNFTVMRVLTTDSAESHSAFDTIYSFRQRTMFTDIHLTVNPLTG